MQRSVESTLRVVLVELAELPWAFWDLWGSDTGDTGRTPIGLSPIRAGRVVCRDFLSAHIAQVDKNPSGRARDSGSCGSAACDATAAGVCVCLTTITFPMNDNYISPAERLGARWFGLAVVFLGATDFHTVRACRQKCSLQSPFSATRFTERW